MRSTKLQRILIDVRREVAAARQRMSEADLWRRIQNAQPVRSLEQTLRSGFGLIAEIKEKSPSGGTMLAQNVTNAPEAYEHSPLVKAISVLTNETHFGMSLNKLESIRAKVNKPILRKDFIIDRYQILEARAYGADAILLMGNVLSREELQAFSSLAFDLGLEVLFESHTQTQLGHIPHEKARIYGINSRLMDSGTKTFLGVSRYSISRALIQAGLMRDLSTDLKKFGRLFYSLPKNAVKVAESGISSSTIAEVRKIGFNAALVGNSLLLAKEGIAPALKSFEKALDQFDASLTPELPFRGEKQIAYSHR